MVRQLVEGGTTTPATTKFPKGRTRKPWGSKAINRVISATARLLEDAYRQGLVPRNLAASVTRVASSHRSLETFTPGKVKQFLSRLDDNRGARVAPCIDRPSTGRDRRASMVGRWSVENGPKSFTSRRTLPLPDRLVVALRDARERQHIERIEAGFAYRSGAYVVSNEIGDPYSPAVLSRYWRDTLAHVGMRHLKLNGARHTAATLMHLDGVPTAVIAAYIGHNDPALTMRLYAHSQDDALRAAANSLQH
jgi:integrase